MAYSHLLHLIVSFFFLCLRASTTILTLCCGSSYFPPCSSLLTLYLSNKSNSLHFPPTKPALVFSLTFFLLLPHICLSHSQYLTLCLSSLSSSPLQLFRGLKPLKGSGHVLLIAALVLTLSQHCKVC